ncbi:MAG: hypothetical protein [Arizlama microvirus]|nr:MAG: hypothetical protein [Arizlama microvirus]
MCRWLSAKIIPMYEAHKVNGEWENHKVAYCRLMQTVICTTRCDNCFIREEGVSNENA